MKKRFWMSALLCVCLVWGTAGSAMGFGSMMVLGDSLSDNATGSGDPFGIGRYTDGPIWVETVAGSLGAALYDGAFGGATTGMDNPAAGSPGLGLQWQVANVVPAFLPAVDVGDTLFSVWAGANDFFQGRDPFMAAANIRAALEGLWAVGARDILVPNLPDLGLTPGFYGDVNPAATAAQATGWVTAFNGALAAQLADFGAARPDATVYAIDVFDIFNGLIDVDADGRIVNSAFWVSLFWDSVHPTAIGHHYIADAALRAVPEPSGVMLIITGAAALLLSRRRLFR